MLVRTPFQRSVTCLNRPINRFMTYLNTLGFELDRNSHRRIPSLQTLLHLSGQRRIANKLGDFWSAPLTTSPPVSVPRAIPDTAAITGNLPTDRWVLGATSTLLADTLRPVDTQLPRVAVTP